MFNWSVWSNSAQRFDNRRYPFYWMAAWRRRRIARSQAYNLGIARYKEEIPGFVKMDLVAIRR